MKYLNYEILTKSDNNGLHTITILDPSGAEVYTLLDIEKEDIKMELAEARFWILERVNS